MAAGEGFEPSQTESESGVLPLHKPAICRAPKRKYYYMQFPANVKRFFRVFSKIFRRWFSAYYRISFSSSRLWIS